MKKFISFIAASAMLLNSFIAPLSVLAQETTPSPEPTTEAAATPVPSEDPTIPVPTETPAEIVEDSSLPTSVVPINPDSLSFVDDSIVEEPAVSEPSGELVSGGEIERENLGDSEVKDSTNEDWNINLEEGYAESKENVKLGVRYVFPMENKVSITFKSLPKDESLRTKLKVQQVKVSDLNLPEGTNPYGEYAYDITTGMSDGTFEYDVTLPKSPDADSDVSYIEKTIDQAKNSVTNEDLKEIDSSKLEQGGDTVKAVSIDHFTIYIVTTNSTESNNNVTNPNNGWVSDDHYAVFDNKDDWVEYGFPTITNPSSIVPGSTINGIEVSIEGYTNDKKDFEISIWNKSSNLYSQKKTASLTKADNVYVLGGSTELWGKSWTVNDFSDANFKIKVDVNNDSGNAYLDSVEVKVYATDPVLSVTNPTLSQSCGLDIAFVLDVSSSIDNTELADMKSAMTEIVDALDGTPTQYSVTKFDATGSVALTFSSDTSAVKTAINGVDGTVGTNWQDGLVKAASTLPGRSNPNLVIFASDGNPNHTGASGTSVSESQAVTDAQVVANSIKTGGTRILAIGIGNNLDTNNLKAISGNNVDKGDILTSDVITSDFDTLADDLAEFASQTCGGTITVNKYIGSIGESNRAGVDWTFDIAGDSKTTDANGQTEATAVTAGSDYSVTETSLSAWPGYSFSSAICKNQTGATVGSGITNGVGSITISNNDIISCDFVNTAPSSEIDWPDDWETPSSCISDAANDENPNSVDLIGDVSTPAVGFAVDSDYAYFRERVNGNPAGSGGYGQYAWVVLFQTSKPEYQYLFSLNGKAEKVQLWENTIPDGAVDFSPLHNDPAETKLWEDEAYQYSRIVSNADGSYYIDWAIPLTELQSRGIDPSVTKFFATSADENNYNKDHLNCYNNLCDVGIDKTDSADPVYKGDTFSYTITVTNTGSDTAENVVVSDTLPVNFSLASVSSSQGACTSLPCNLGSIASGASATIIITGSGTAVGTLTNVTSVNTSTLDIDLTNNSDSEDTVVNEKNGRIVVDKVTNPSGSTQSFSFDAGGGSYADFSLTNSATPNSQELIAGAYSISEKDVTGWEKTSISCVSSIGDTETIGNLELDPGETITCTFTNTQLPKLTVIKSLSPTTDPGLFNLQIDGTIYVPDVGNGGSTGARTLTVGQHSVGETAGTGTSLSDYNTIYSPNCPGGLITLAAGDDETCTITNTRKTGNVVIDKIVIGGAALESDWIFTIFSVLGTYQDGSQLTLNTGSYTISETTSVPGYTLTSVGGICSGMSTPSATLTVSERGGTCVFTNTRDTGSVKVNKQLDTNGDGTYESGNTEANTLGFAWILDTGANTAMGTPIGSVETTVGSTTHSVNEYNPGNYHFTGWYTNGSDYSCTSPKGTTLPININVSKGITTEITLCNARDVGSITVEKDVVPNDSSTWDFTVTSVPAGYQGSINLSDGGLHTFTNLPTGDYIIDETAGAGVDASQYIPTFSGDCVDREATPPGHYIHLESGNSKSCKITNTKKAKIVVNKVTVPAGSDQTFHFNGNYTAGFNLQDAGSNDSGWMDYHSPYYVSEDSVTNWGLSDISCVESVNQNSTVNLSSNKVDITLEPGEIVTCTFTNTRDTGYLYFTKTVNPHYETNSPEWNFSIGGTNADVGGWDLGDGNWAGLQLPTGDYSITEVANSTNDPTKTYDSAYQCIDVASPNVPFPTGTYTITGTGTSTGNLTVQKDHTMWCEFINTERSSIVVHKFEDKNKDGQQNGSDRDLQGWQMYLYSGSTCTPAALITNGQTNSDGLITFDNLISGTYSVYDNYFWTNPNDNPSEPTNGPACRTVTLTPGQNENIDFGNFIRWQISGKKFVDTNGNGIWDTGESPKKGVEIDFFVYDGDEWISSPVNSSYMTKPDGSYTYQSYDPRPFRVCEVVPEGWQRTMPSSSNCYDITPESGGNYTNYDFGNFELTYIQGRKYHDYNANGEQDGIEPNINGWTIRLYDSDWHQVGSEQSTHFILGSGKGRYRFENLFKGTYYICEVLQSGWTQTDPKSPEGFANLSGRTDEAPRCRKADISTSGVPVTGKLFGNVEYGSVTVTKFSDVDQDGYYDSDESVLSGWDITLDATTKTTDVNGQTLFENLIAGRYDLTENFPQDSNWNQTNIYCDDDKNLSDGQVVLGAGQDINCYIGNFEEKPSIAIGKSNDSGSGVHAGSIVTYTITLTNDGNIPLHNMYITDVLPGGFSYVAGSTTGATTDDPVISGSTLSWYIGTIPSVEDNVVQIQYNAQTSSNLADGIYTNFATCSNSERENDQENVNIARQLTFYRFVPISCSLADSTVAIGSTFGYSGRLGGQVLGISTELPATGNPTWILIAAVGALATGIALNVIAKTRAKKSNEEEEMVKKEEDENEKE